jgi:hypothetical protein
MHGSFLATAATHRTPTGSRGTEGLRGRALLGAYISDAPRDTGISFLGRRDTKTQPTPLACYHGTASGAWPHKLLGCRALQQRWGFFPQVPAQAGGGLWARHNRPFLTSTGMQGAPIALGICATRRRTGRGEVLSAAQLAASTSTDNDTSQGSSIGWSSQGTNYPANWQYYLAYDNSNANLSNSNLQGSSIATSASADTHRGA